MPYFLFIIDFHVTKCILTWELGIWDGDDRYELHFFLQHLETGKNSDLCLCIGLFLVKICEDEGGGDGYGVFRNLYFRGSWNVKSDILLSAGRNSSTSIEFCWKEIVCNLVSKALMFLTTMGQFAILFVTWCWWRQQNVGRSYLLLLFFQLKKKKTKLILLTVAPYEEHRRRSLGFFLTAHCISKLLVFWSTSLTLCVISFIQFVVCEGV